MIYPSRKNGPEDHLGIITVTTPPISLEHAETGRGEEWWQDYFLLDFWMWGHLVSFSRQGRPHSEPQGQGRHSDQRRQGLHLRPWRWHCCSSRPRKQNIQSKRIILEPSGPVEFASPEFGLAWNPEIFLVQSISTFILKAFMGHLLQLSESLLMTHWGGRGDLTSLEKTGKKR